MNIRFPGAYNDGSKGLRPVGALIKSEFKWIAVDLKTTIISGSVNIQITL